MARTIVAAGGRTAASARSSSVSARLVFIRIVGGFLDGVFLELSENLNCFIGARGAGKSTVFEFVRFVLNALPDAQVDAAAHRRIESLVEQNLGGGRVELGIHTKEGLSYLISRSVGEDPVVLTADGRPTELTFSVGGLFKAHIFSQNEVEGIADRALSQLVLLDRFEAERIAEIEGKIRGIVSKLTSNAGEIDPLQRQIIQLAEAIGTLPEVEEKLKGFAVTGGENAQAINWAHQHKALRDRERRAIEAMHQFLGDYQDQSTEQAQRVIEALAGSNTLFDLETVELIDLPRIELKDGEDYMDSSALSTGQKCTTILPILLLDSDGPLLVDQPEDNLDNRFIFKCVVESIRRIKRHRQLLFVTHNPNIPVLGDAERVFVLESDGTRARKANEGTVDQCKEEIVMLLKGGEAAFKERSNRYAYS